MYNLYIHIPEAYGVYIDIHISIYSPHTARSSQQWVMSHLHAWNHACMSHATMSHVIRKSTNSFIWSCHTHIHMFIHDYISDARMSHVIRKSTKSFIWSCHTHLHMFIHHYISRARMSHVIRKSTNSPTQTYHVHIQELNNSHATHKNEACHTHLHMFIHVYISHARRSHVPRKSTNSLI